MENTQTQKTPETLKPEQMESGKWYVVDTFLIKFKKITDNCIYRYKCYELETKTNFSGNPNGYISTENNLIRPATKEEVLKYFPDEVFEPIELQPEEPTDWEAKYNELTQTCNELTQIIADLKSELAEKYNKQEPKGEKVYFFTDHSGNLRSSNDIQFVLERSGEDYRIFEANVIGKKKSVLVNE